jgi:ATP-dependent DNA helicase RecG
MAAVRLDMPVKFLKGVGEKRAEAFGLLGVRTVHDLLLHLPFRYLDASSLTPLAKAEVGSEVACVGQVVTKGVLPTRRGLRIFHAVLRDASGLLECVWPGQAFLDRTIEVGQTLLVAGPVRFYHGRQLAPREYVVLAEPDTDEDSTAMDRGQVMPVYPATKGLSHRLIRSLVARHLDTILPLVSDPLPTSTREALGLPSVSEALQAVHRPARLADAEDGRRRLAFDELVDLQLMLGRARLLAKASRGGIGFQIRKQLTTRLKEALPWELTRDQRRALREITTDMTSAERMHRLLMGDVGTGKTVVALFAMLLALENDYQAALMAPTELLAEQHGATLRALLAPLALEPELLLGRFTGAEKEAVRQRIRSGEARIIVGTHALFQQKVEFHRLGFVVIDEQHRFGVEQRAALIAKGDVPDVLLLTATPIPRSLALTRYGDLDMSVLRERPPGRPVVRTAVRGPKQRTKVFEFVREACLGGRQAFVVLPLIEESEKADLRAAKVLAEQLAEQWPDLTVGLVHGQLKTEERDRVMLSFREGVINVLVATTVIEVGIDIPGASIMVIDHPERFGLAQLHQLRGRIGRGTEESHCILLAPGPIPRLKAFAATTDGFKIAELDLEERRQGDLLGQRQSGDAELRIARFPGDSDLLQSAREFARALLAEDPLLDRKTHRGLRDRALARHPRGEVLFRTG